MGGLTGAFTSANISADRLQEELRRDSAMSKANNGSYPYYMQPSSRTLGPLVKSDPHTSIPTRGDVECDTSTSIAADTPVNHVFVTGDNGSTIRRGNKGLHSTMQPLAFSRPLSDPATTSKNHNSATGRTDNSGIKDAENNGSLQRAQTCNEATFRTTNSNERSIHTVHPNVMARLFVLSTLRFQCFQIPLPVDTDNALKIDIMVSGRIGYRLVSGCCNMTSLDVTPGVAQSVANATMSLHRMIWNDLLYVQRVFVSIQCFQMLKRKYIDDYHWHGSLLRRGPEWRLAATS